MAERSQVKSSVGTSKGAKSGVFRLFTVEGFPIKALSELKLPRGAKIAIISTGTESVGAIKKTVKGRNLKIKEILLQRAHIKTVARKVIVNKEAFKPDARSRALIEGIRIAEEDLRKSGGAYDLDEVRALMRGVTRQAIDKRVQEGSLLAVPGPSNRRSYPTLQFNRDGSVVPGLKAVREALRTRNSWTVLNFLTNPDGRLGDQKPIDLLKTRKLEIVLEAAKRFGEQGA